MVEVVVIVAIVVIQRRRKGTFWRGDELNTHSLPVSSCPPSEVAIPTVVTRRVLSNARPSVVHAHRERPYFPRGQSYVPVAHFAYALTVDAILRCDVRARACQKRVASASCERPAPYVAVSHRGNPNARRVLSCARGGSRHELCSRRDVRTYNNTSYDGDGNTKGEWKKKIDVYSYVQWYCVDSMWRPSEEEEEDMELLDIRKQWTERFLFRDGVVCLKTKRIVSDLSREYLDNREGGHVL